MRYRTLAYLAGILVLAACGQPSAPNRVPVKQAKANVANTCQSGWVVRTGESGDSTCAPGF